MADKHLLFILEAVLNFLGSESKVVAIPKPEEAIRGPKELQTYFLAVWLL